MARFRTSSPQFPIVIRADGAVAQTYAQQPSQGTSAPSTIVPVVPDERTRLSFVLNYEPYHSEWYGKWPDCTESNGLEALADGVIDASGISSSISSPASSSTTTTTQPSTSPTTSPKPPPNGLRSNVPYTEIECHFLRFHNVDLGMSWLDVKTLFEQTFTRKLSDHLDGLTSRYYRDNVIPCRRSNGDIWMVLVRNQKTGEIEVDPRTNQPIRKVLMKKYHLQGQKESYLDALYWADYTGGLLLRCPEVILSHDWPSITDEHRKQARLLIDARGGHVLPGAYWEDRISKDDRPIEERALHRMGKFTIYTSSKSKHTKQDIIKYRREHGIIPHEPNGTSDVEHEYAPVYNRHDFDEFGQLIRRN